MNHKEKWKDARLAAIARETIWSSWCVRESEAGPLLGLARRERYDTARENGTLEMSMMYKSSVDIVHDVQRLLM